MEWHKKIHIDSAIKKILISEEKLNQTPNNSNKYLASRINYMAIYVMSKTKLNIQIE